MPNPAVSTPRMDTEDSPWVSADEAARLLGVKRASLYSYVSRGLLRAQRHAGAKGSSYLLSDVSRLARQREAVRSPARLAQTTLDWGQAILPSTITLVRDGQFHYRGRNAVEFAAHATLEEAANLLWQTDTQAITTRAPSTPQRRTTSTLPGTADVLASWGSQPLAPSPHPERLLQAMAHTLLGLPLETAAQAVPAHEILRHHWGLNDSQADVLRRALVLCADHELNASTFAVRVVASTGASLQASMGAGLAALSGPLHGGMTALIDQHWDTWHHHAQLHGALHPGLLALLKSTQTGKTPHYCAGFGHPLYPQGDPRSLALMPLLEDSPKTERLRPLVLEHSGLHPSLDYALVAVQRALRLPQGAAFVLFALGRSVGWIAHAMEQQSTGQLIRPRAVYVGNEPENARQLPAKPGAAGSADPLRALYGG